MPEPPSSKELPVSLLTDPVMIGACQVRDFGRVFQLVKARAGIYPSMIARRCDLTPSRVGEVIAGRRQLLHMDVIERISDGLRIPGHMLGLARRSWETPRNLTVTPRELPEEPTPAEAQLAAGCLLARPHSAPAWQARRGVPHRHGALAPAAAVSSQRVAGHLREFYEQLEPYRREPVAMAFESRLREILPRQVSGSTRP
ncbi:hypothetical protein [Streptomyces gardneri]|uniref:Uncharacterized protein n=1 Tax=Streptomyces gardneri TaxID=66892 RepID=A0A4Y3RWX2_9ACTN|nr:hypothetical protein [Streptomyces gardneri]GEB61895.1 hypothetical protein SGA01_75000 [Streptomyces gardneri]GHH19686.1 hypothetical protein GCM10017674_72810 [Streptomyces gardneri]